MCGLYTREINLKPYFLSSQYGITPIEDDRWETIDAQLCVVLKGTLDPSLKQLFRSYEICAQI